MPHAPGTFAWRPLQGRHNVQSNMLRGHLLRPSNMGRVAAKQCAQTVDRGTHLVRPLKALAGPTPGQRGLQHDQALRVLRQRGVKLLLAVQLGHLAWPPLSAKSILRSARRRRQASLRALDKPGGWEAGKHMLGGTSTEHTKKGRGQGSASVPRHWTMTWGTSKAAAAPAGAAVLPMRRNPMSARRSSSSARNIARNCAPRSLAHVSSRLAGKGN